MALPLIDGMAMAGRRSQKIEDRLLAKSSVLALHLITIQVVAGSALDYFKC